MAKNKLTFAKPLAGYWMAPERPEGCGAAVACIATTFEFDAAFFEGELLPRFLGLKFDNTEAEATFIVEREESLASVAAAVLVDASKVDPKQTTLRWDQLPIALPGGLQHAKLSLLIWERHVRLLVASANLTSSGYRRNREVFASLDFLNDCESVPLSVLKDATSLIEAMLTWARVPEMTRQRTATAIDRVKKQIRAWKLAPAEFTPKQRPRIALAATCPRVNGKPARSALDQLLGIWGARSASEITVVTPFVGQCVGKEDPVVARLMVITKSRDCTGWLGLPQVGCELPKIGIPIPQGFCNSWKTAFATRGGSRVLPLPLHVDRFDKINRPLHAKIVALESDFDVLLMIGSSNFSPHGMGVAGAYNVEANLVYFSDNDSSLWPRLGIPLDWNNESFDIEDANLSWLGQPPVDESTPERTNCVPPFFAAASYAPKRGFLKVEFDRSQSEPMPWAIGLSGGALGEVTLFSSEELGDSQPQVREHTLPPEHRGVDVTSLQVSWTDEFHQRQHAPFIVCVEDPTHLLPPGSLVGLNLDALIDCLISGRSLAEEVDRRSRVAAKSLSDAATDSLQAVDTSGYLLYRVRRFVRAVAGICERLQRTPPFLQATEYRLKDDPLGPLSLAKLIVAPADDGAPSWFHGFSAEHRLFLLAELLLAFPHCGARGQCQPGTKTGKEMLRAYQQAAGEIQQLIDGESAKNLLPANLQSYLQRVASESRRLLQVNEHEVAHAG